MHITSNLKDEPTANNEKKRALSIGLDKHIFGRKIVNIFLPTSFTICFGSSKEQSQ